MYLVTLRVDSIMRVNAEQNSDEHQPQDAAHVLMIHRSNTGHAVPVIHLVNCKQWSSAVPVALARSSMATSVAMGLFTKAPNMARSI